MNLATGLTSSGKVAITASRPGSKNSYRLLIGSRYPYGAGVSLTKQFAHYVWRGAFTEMPVLTGSSVNGQVIRDETNVAKSTALSQTFAANGAIQLRADVNGCDRARSWTAIRGTTPTLSPSTSAP